MSSGWTCTALRTSRCARAARPIRPAVRISPMPASNFPRRPGSNAVWPGEGGHPGVHASVPAAARPSRRPSGVTDLVYRRDVAVGLDRFGAPAGRRRAVPAGRGGDDRFVRRRGCEPVPAARATTDVVKVGGKRESLARRHRDSDGDSGRGGRRRSDPCVQTATVRSWSAISGAHPASTSRCPSADSMTGACTVPNGASRSLAGPSRSPSRRVCARAPVALAGSPGGALQRASGIHFAANRIASVRHREARTRTRQPHRYDRRRLDD